MPRVSGSGKRQQGAAGHRDSRHDNGLVGPAKRHSGRKSNGTGDASARAAPENASGLAGTSSPVHAHANGLSKPPVDGAVLDSQSTDPARRPSLGTYSETSSESCNSNMGVNGTIEGGHRQIDVNALKDVDVHRDSGPFDLAFTVLTSLPIQDTLAILIVLMQLPSLSLSVIYAIFTFLTFVPPVTTSSGMNINLAEIFEGVNSMPSLVTVMCMDFFFFMVWLFLWQPMQDVILDLAKPVIAITLGGGTSVKDGTSRGVTTCFTWVLFHHLLESTRNHWYRVVRLIPEDWSPFEVVGSYLDEPDKYDRRSPYGWIKSVLGIHILTQGVVRYIREWYLKREKVNSSLSQNDPEAAKPTNATNSSNASHDAGFNTPETELGPTSPPPSNQLTNKKKRKQSAQVRLQQPLWAALASTKIVVVKEYELSHPRPESAGSNATDIHNLGNAPFDTQPAQVWISYIGSDEVCFNTSHFPDVPSDSASVQQNGHATRPTGIDQSKPFYVRVNNAVWQPTRIFQVEDTEGEAGEGPRWTGDIYGLRPASKYVCEFVDSRTGEVVFVTSIRTVKETRREKDGVAAALDGQTLRPETPTTTLKTSVAAAEAKLTEEKNRLKTWRKEWKSRINTLKRENELLDNQLTTAGSNDEKHRQKIRQHETQKAQAERETEELSAKLRKFDSAPELHDRKKKVEKLYSAEKKVYDAAQKEYKEYKAKLESEVKAKEVERSNLNTKRNKIATRIAKVETELANLADANSKGLNEVERRKRVNAIWEDNVAAIEANYRDRIETVNASNIAKMDQIRLAEDQLQSLQAILHGHGILNGTVPIDVSGLPSEAMVSQLPHTSPWNPNPTAAPHYPQTSWNDSATDSGPALPNNHGAMPNFSPWKPASSASLAEPRGSGSKARGRSSSMLSDVSGFTQSSEEETRSPAGVQVPGRGYGSIGSSGSDSVPVSPIH